MAGLIILLPGAVTFVAMFRAVLYDDQEADIPWSSAFGLSLLAAVMWDMDLGRDHPSAKGTATAQQGGVMPEVPTVTININKEAVSFAVCGACWCLTRQEDFPKHQDWHVELDRRIRAAAGPVMAESLCVHCKQPILRCTDDYVGHKCNGWRHVGYRGREGFHACDPRHLANLFAEPSR